MKTHTLTPEQEQIRIVYEKQYDCEIYVYTLPLNRQATEKQDVFLREPTLQELDIYVRTSQTNPVLCNQSMFATLLICEDTVLRKKLVENKYAVMGITPGIEAITSYFSAILKKSENNSESK